MTPTPYSSSPYIPLLELDAAGDSTYDSHMGFQPPELKQTPPKLSLYSLPSKPTPLPDGLTPPLNTVATIPFLWEEAPGKPRPTSDDPPKSKTVRSLDLPPRLTTTTTTTVSPVNNGVGIEIIPSPTTVLSGPYEGVYGSKTRLGSPEKVVVVGSNSNKSKGKMRMPLRKLMRKDRSPVKFSSWRWDSGDRSVERSPSLRFCSWRWDSFRDMGGGGGGGGGSLCSSFDERRKSVDSDDKIGKVTRKNSFTFDDGGNTTSSFLKNMFGTFKKAMPWRSRR